MSVLSTTSIASSSIPSFASAETEFRREQVQRGIHAARAGASSHTGRRARWFTRRGATSPHDVG